MTPPDTSPAAPVDTSAEAVAELVRELERYHPSERNAHLAAELLAAVVKERDTWMRDARGLATRLNESDATVAQFEKLMAEIAEAVGKTTWFGDLAQLVKATLFEARESGRLAGRAEAAEIARGFGVPKEGEGSPLPGVRYAAALIADAILSASTTPLNPDARTGCADDALPGTADEWRDGLRVAQGWTGRKCVPCGGSGLIRDDSPTGESRCNACGGTGDEYGPVTVERSPHRDPGGAHGG